MTDPGRTGTVPVVGYAYPWDVIGDPSFADRARGIGVTKVALAAAYHTARAATPLHPRHRFVEARSAALYRPVRPEAWDGARLVPPAATWVAAEDPFGEASAILAEAGIEVAAWIVLTHSTLLGESNPDLAVVNCWDEPYPYALCPRHEDVRRYAETLAAEAVRDTPTSTAVLEACGQLGFDHGGHHEKTHGAYDAATEDLLSICCCPACREDWSSRGLDPEATVAALRAATGPAPSGPAPSGAAMDANTLATILASRHAATDELRRRVIAAVREAAPGIVEIALHAQPDPWATGASPGLTPATADDVDLVVSFCWPTTEASVETGRRLVEAVDAKAAAAAYVTVLPPTTEDGFGGHVRALVDAGVDQIHLYHLGLAGADRQHLLAGATEIRKDA